MMRLRFWLWPLSVGLYCIVKKSKIYIKFYFSLYGPKDRGRSRSRSQNRSRTIAVVPGWTNDAAPVLAPAQTCFIQFECILTSICIILICYTVYTAGGNAVGPYTDHFSKGQNHAKKLKFRKNRYKYVTLWLKCTFPPNMNKKFKKKFWLL
jgi:hypothetical protein